MPDRYLTPPEIAEQLGVDPAKVIRWIRAGELPAVNVAERGCRRPRFRVSPESLDIFLGRRSAAPPPVSRPPARRRMTLPVATYY